MSVARAQAEISAREFAEWMAFHGLSPIDDERQDFHAAQIVATLVNAHRDPKSDPVRVVDFMPYTEKPPKPRQTPEQMREVLMGWSVISK